MNNNIKKLIKIIGLILILALITIICVLTISFNNAKLEEMETPVHIVPVKEQTVPKEVIPPSQPVKPVTRDENNMPKSDYKVPEIG